MFIPEKEGETEKTKEILLSLPFCSIQVFPEEFNSQCATPLDQITPLLMIIYYQEPESLIRTALINLCVPIK